MTCKCGRQTNDPSGICAICNLKANDPDTIQGTGNREQGTAGTKAQRDKGQKKNKVPKRDFICVQCQKPYKPTSSAQKRCPECKKIHIAEYQKKYKNKTSDLQPQAARKKTHQPSTANCEVTGCKNPIKSKGLCNKHYLQKPIGIRKNKTSQVSSGRHSREGGNPEKKELDTRLKTSGMTENQKQDISRPLTPESRPQKDVIPVPPSVIPAQAGIQSGSNGLLAQMLYASDLLDKQINEVLETGIIDTKIILDIRFRLGEVVRGSIPV